MIRVNYKINEEEKKTLLEMHTKKGYKTIVEDDMGLGMEDNFGEDDYNTHELDITDLELEEFETLDFQDNEKDNFDTMDYRDMGDSDGSEEMDYEIIRMNKDEMDEMSMYEEMSEDNEISAEDFKSIYGEKDDISLAENHIKKIVKKVLKG